MYACMHLCIYASRSLRMHAFICVHVYECACIALYVCILQCIHTFITGYSHLVEVGCLSTISSRDHSFKVSGFFWVLSARLPMSHDARFHGYRTLDSMNAPTSIRFRRYCTGFLPSKIRCIQMRHQCIYIYIYIHVYCICIHWFM